MTVTIQLVRHLRITNHRRAVPLVVRLVVQVEARLAETYLDVEKFDALDA